jgi:3-hydroxybutyryl-CoA dehydrogenase
LSVTEIASATKRPDKVVGVHFFNPPVTLPLVEVIPGMETSEETVNDIIDFMSTIRNHRYPMQPIKVKEVPGFLVNRILFAMMNEAYSCYDEGVASMRDIDLAMKAGAGMPMGPFELSDLVGIDVIYHVENEVRKMTGGNTMRKPSQTIRKLYHSGRYGKKTKRGFYDYR